MADTARRPRRTFTPPWPGPSGLKEIVARTIAIFRAYPLPFMVIALVTALPIGLVAIAIDLAYTVPDDEAQKALAALIGVLPSILLVPISGAAAAVAVIDCVNGGQPRISHALEKVGERFWPLAAVIAVTTIGLVLGVMALLVPGIILLVFWLFASSAVVVEGLGVRGALARSRQLVRGAFWPVLGVYLLIEIGAALVGVLLLIPLDAIALAFNGDAEKIVSGIAEVVVTTVVQPLAMIGVALMYLDRRVRAEGSWPKPSQAT
jgi:hypothetical protein